MFQIKLVQLIFHLKRQRFHKLQDYSANLLQAINGVRLLKEEAQSNATAKLVAVGFVANIVARSDKSRHFLRLLDRPCFAIW